MNVVLLWHMHQPYYVNPLTKMAMMPWVRLHAVKGYLDMIDLTEVAPQVKMNFNFSPVLVLQIQELTEGKVTDLWESWSRKPAKDLLFEEKKQILENFFKINWETMIKPHPRYHELLNLRGKIWNEKTISESIHLFTESDFRDLQTWYNLAWCGFSARKRYPILQELIEQERDFTEEQKIAVLDVHRAILKQVLGLYKEAETRGQIEITATPFFHPIMPLVYDTEIARRCMPHASLPLRFSQPEDVRAHLRLAQELHEKVFGQKARGVWPSEGSIAPEIIPLLQEAGFQYFCSDEGNLFKSLQQDPKWHHRASDRLELFKGWRFHHEGSEIQALFRERPLSDFIGFNAARNDAAISANYLLETLDKISEAAPSPDAVVCIALDGENAWEAFRDGGEEFLTKFYQGLAKHSNLRSQKLGSYFSEFPAKSDGNHLHSGSWIRSDFDIWIGDPEENKGWEWIGQTRKFLVDSLAKNPVSAEKEEAAWMEIYASEGSDWFWWYGPDFTIDTDLLFDELFRTHLQNVYHILGATPPAYLDVPICLPSDAVHYSIPNQYISPSTDGKLHHFYEWVGAGQFNILQQQTAMFQADRIGQRLYFGFNREYFFIRLDAVHAPKNLQIQLTSPVPLRLKISQEGNKGFNAHLQKSEDQISFTDLKVDLKVAWSQFLIIAIPIHALKWNGQGTVSFFMEIFEKDLLKERFPERGAIEFPAPQLDFEAQQWFV